MLEDASVQQGTIPSVLREVMVGGSLIQSKLLDFLTVSSPLCMLECRYANTPSRPLVHVA